MCKCLFTNIKLFFVFNVQPFHLDWVQSIDFYKHLGVGACVLGIFGLIIIRPVLLGDLCIWKRVLLVNNCGVTLFLAHFNHFWGILFVSKINLNY